MTWIHSRIHFPRIVLFLDRDQADRDGARQAFKRLRRHGFEVSVLDWDRKTDPIPDSIKDPGDMPVEQLHGLRNQGII